MDTIGYYNKYASAIFEQTVEQDMEERGKPLRSIWKRAIRFWILGAALDVTAWPFMNRASM